MGRLIRRFKLNDACNLSRPGSPEWQLRYSGVYGRPARGLIVTTASGEIQLPWRTEVQLADGISAEARHTGVIHLILADAWRWQRNQEPAQC